MIIAVASGKGGTGKTTVATSLALSLAIGNRVRFLDCDVEAPNAHLFLKPSIEHSTDATLPVPVIDQARCNLCGICTDVCQYHALAVTPRQVLIFPEMCHGCGSCTLNCPSGAIQETPRVLGRLERGGTPEGIQFARGILNVGEALAASVIRQLKAAHPAGPRDTIILDAPPGTSCPVVETVRDADFVFLVTEPTPFGLHDLKLAYELTCELGLPAGVIVNRDGIGDQGVDHFCLHAGLPILLRIPMSRAIAAGIAQGVPLVTLEPEYHSIFRRLFRTVAGVQV